MITYIGLIAPAKRAELITSPGTIRGNTVYLMKYNYICLVLQQLITVYKHMYSIIYRVCVHTNALHLSERYSLRYHYIPHSVQTVLYLPIELKRGYGAIGLHSCNGKVYRVRHRMYTDEMSPEERVSG